VATGFYKAVTDILKQNGFRFDSNAKGSHEKWRTTLTGKVMIVPRNLKSRHTANAICKDIGVGKRF
jgi:predicted RNA binding protein YcfA (HicA-like mRNA interferase family)